MGDQQIVDLCNAAIVCCRHDSFCVTGLVWISPVAKGGGGRSVSGKPPVSD